MSLFRPNIDAMTGYVPGEQPSGGQFVKLNTNENPYPPSPRVLDAIRRAATDRLRLYPDPLATVFREKAAQVHGLEPDWILAGNGSDDLLTIVTRSFVGPGDRVVYPYPSYLCYETLAQLQAAATRTVPFADAWRLPPDLARSDARLTFLPNPNSPSGTLAGVADVAELARGLRTPLVIDEAYVDFAPESCVALVRDHPHVIVTRSLSKSHSLAGIRLGYAIAQPDLISGLIKVKDSYNCDALSIIAGAAALDDPAWTQENIRKIRATRARLTAALRELGFSIPDSQANFVWCTSHEIAARPVYEELKRRAILIRYLDYPGYGDGLRISVGTDAEIDRLLDELRNLV